MLQPCGSVIESPLPPATLGRDTVKVVPSPQISCASARSADVTNRKGSSAIAVVNRSNRDVMTLLPQVMWHRYDRGRGRRVASFVLRTHYDLILPAIQILSET